LLAALPPMRRLEGAAQWMQALNELQELREATGPQELRTS